MKLYVLVISLLIGISTLGKLLCLAKKEFPPRTAKIEAMSVVINFALLIWAATLLTG